VVDGISRREFLRKSIGAGTMLSLSGVDGLAYSLFSVTRGIRCKKCGVENCGHEVAINFLIFGSRPVCSNCGVELSSGRWLADTKCQLSCMSDGSATKHEYPCCNLPFPNHALVKGSPKPRLVLSELNF